MKFFRLLLADTRGASMTEYALLLAMIALGTIGAVTAFQQQIFEVFESLDIF